MGRKGPERNPEYRQNTKQKAFHLKGNNRVKTPCEKKYLQTQ